jgi:excisionase family DNA binding protein
MKSMDSLPTLLLEDRVAEYLFVSKSTLEAWRRKGKLAYYRWGGRVFYEVKDVLDFIRANHFLAARETKET